MTDKLQLALESFYNRAMGIPAKPCAQVFEAATVKEFEQAAAMLLRVQSKLCAKHIDAKLGGIGNSVTLFCYGYTLRVKFAKVSKHTNVTDTSKDAYHISKNITPGWLPKR